MCVYQTPPRPFHFLGAPEKSKKKKCKGPIVIDSSSNNKFTELNNSIIMLHVRKSFKMRQKMQS
jgi:hypothetical protein